jgi:spore coat protein A
MGEQPPGHAFLPIDTTIPGAEPPTPTVRTVVHLHGSETLPESDGYPEAWFTNGFRQTGPFFTDRVYHYPNDQQATTLWYHDHALGITRLNVYAGLSGFYILRDDHEDSLDLPKGDFEIPLVIQDRFLNSDGSLLYPVVTPGDPDPRVPPIWIPEFFGDTVLVNGRSGRSWKSSRASTASAFSTVRTRGSTRMTLRRYGFGPALGGPAGIPPDRQ